MDDITQLCQKYNLLLIEDSAQTLGATWQGRQAGSFGIGCFSFYPTKNITSGLGGMLSCRDDNLARQARAFITHGIFYDSKKFISPWARSAEMAGHNYQMSNLQAALGYRQLLRLNDLNIQRETLAERYNYFLSSWEPLVKRPSVAQGATHVYQMYTIQIKDFLRDQVLKELWTQNIWAGIHFDPPVHLQPFYLRNGTKPLSLPVTERLAKELITLPLYPGMTEPEQDYVVHNLEKAINKTIK